MTLCDGEPSTRFSFRNTGGGLTLPGSQVLSENGFNFLIVNGQCHFWASPDTHGDAHEGDLSADQARELTNSLRLSDWSSLKGDYFDDLCDGPTREYRFAGQNITVHANCGGGKNSQPVDWLLNQSSGQLHAVYDSGTPVTGPVRFVLMTEQDGVVWSIAVTNAAARWPLSDDPSVSAVTSDQASNYQIGSSRSVQPPDADALRTARRSFVDAGLLQFSGGFVPVLGPQDEKYELFIRDSISLEDTNGLLHLD